MAIKLNYTLPEGFKFVKRLRGHTAHATFLAQCETDSIGMIERRQEIPSPYAFSPEWSVWLYVVDNKMVIIRETTQRVFDVIEVPQKLVTFDA